MFLRGCRSKWFEFDDENGRNGWLFVTTFQGKQPTYIHISDRNIGFAFLVVALSVECKKGLRSILHTVQYLTNLP